MFRLIIFSGTLIFVQMVSLLGAEVNGSSLIIPEPLKDLGKNTKLESFISFPPIKGKRRISKKK